jgi:hypothetical protein
VTRKQAEVAGDRREQCVNLLSLARHFRVLMENAYDSRGPVLDPNIEQVRRSVADIATQADRVEFNVPKAGTAAVSLADEARKLALTAEEKNREHGSSLVPDDFTKFDDCLEAFKNSARLALEGPQGRTGWGPVSFSLNPASARATCLCAGESGGSLASIASWAKSLAETSSPARSETRAA